MARARPAVLKDVDTLAKPTQRFYLDWGQFDPRRETDRLNVPGFTRRLAERLEARGEQVTSREWKDGSSVAFWVDRR